MRGTARLGNGYLRSPRRCLGNERGREGERERGGQGGRRERKRGKKKEGGRADFFFFLVIFEFFFIIIIIIIIIYPSRVVGAFTCTRSFLIPSVSIRHKRHDDANISKNL